MIGQTEIHYFRRIFNSIELFTYACIDGKKIHFKMRYNDAGVNWEGIKEACKAIDLGYVKRWRVK